MSCSAKAETNETRSERLTRLSANRLVQHAMSASTVQSIRMVEWEDDTVSSPDRRDCGHVAWAVQVRGRVGVKWV